MRKGMTLVELMVSMVILMIVLGAVYSIMSIQQTRATNVSKTAVLQTDAQVAFTLLKWDLLMVGLGYPFTRSDAIFVPAGGSNVLLKAVGLGFEMNRARWSYVLTHAFGEPQTELLLRRWADTLSNFRGGDTVLMLDANREPIYQNIVIADVETTFYYDTLWERDIPAQRIFLSGAVAIDYGTIVFQRSSTPYYSALTYTSLNDTLKRGNEVLLTNVEAIQFRYGIDQNGDGVVETWSNQNATLPNPSYLKKWGIRFTAVFTSEPILGYKYPANSITIENSPPYTYTLSPVQQRKKRVILQTTVYPQNLQPPERM